jgi:glycosyltransferase involved in cell wall biosynthesis
MKLFFWQNVNSIHQSTFFKSLILSSHEVTLVVTESISLNRLKMGWNTPNIDGLKIIDISSSDNNWQIIIDENSEKKSFHIFSGIGAFPKVYRSFKYALNKNCYIGVFTEPYDLRGVKGFFKQIRGFYYKFAYEKNIDIILTTGKLGLSQFQYWGFSEKKIAEWAYTVEESVNNLCDVLTPANDVFNIMFAGSLIPRKGYDVLVDALIELDKCGIDFSADLYCLPEDKTDFEIEVVKNNRLKDKIHFLPFLKNKDVRKKMIEYDVFILPSRHDGWGAVINESLAEGTPVIVSNKCGSSTLVQNNDFGVILEELTSEVVAKTIKNIIVNSRHTNISRRKEIKSWYNSNVSGSSMTNYFECILDYIFYDSFKPKAPWS